MQKIYQILNQFGALLLLWVAKSAQTLATHLLSCLLDHHCKVNKKKQLGCSKVGLGIINSLVNETKLNGELLGTVHRENKAMNLLNSNSLPKNYTVSLTTETKNSNSEVVSYDDVE